jgi:hypothetical protein
MPVYTLDVIPISAMSFIGSAPSTHSAGDGSGWAGQNYSFTYDSGEVGQVSITDADSAFQDDSENPEWGGHPWPAHQQQLTSDTQIGGVTHLAGTRIEDEYELFVTDQFGTVYRMVAVMVSASPTEPPWGSWSVVGYTFDGAWPPEGAILTSVNGTNQDQQEINPVCFCKGTLIATPAGDIPVEDIAVGADVLTADGRIATVRWHGCRRLSALDLLFKAKLRPICIQKGALGNGLPRRDLLVSPQHRILARSVVVSRMVEGSDEALLAAKHLVGLPGIGVTTDRGDVEYHHLMCDGHELLVAEGAITESLYPGPQALKSISPQQYEEILALFPEICSGSVDMPPARVLLPGRRARNLVRRLERNSVPVFC